jgi:hypothetical protein
MKAALRGGCYTFFMGLHPNSPFLHAMYCQLIAQHLERHGLAEVRRCRLALSNPH